MRWRCEDLAERLLRRAPHPLFAGPRMSRCMRPRQGQKTGFFPAADRQKTENTRQRADDREIQDRSVSAVEAGTLLRPADFLFDFLFLLFEEDTPWFNSGPGIFSPFLKGEKEDFEKACSNPKEHLTGIVWSVPEANSPEAAGQKGGLPASVSTLTPGQRI